MSVSRRGFLQGLRGGRTTQLSGVAMAAGTRDIYINRNENPLGPGKAAIEALLGKFPEANRYSFNGTPRDADLAILIASQNGGKQENVLLGVGSQELLRNAVRAWMSPTKHLAEVSPTYGNCSGQARQENFPIKSVPVDARLNSDLQALLPIARGAGLVYISNPNNPTATIVGAKALADFVADVRKTSPASVILIDEAYHDYVTDPSYHSAIPLALSTPNVLVARTFSKAYGMAGVRIGYAIGMADTIRPLARYRMPNNVNTFGVAAAIASLKDPQHIKDESARNQQVRAFTVKALADLGYKSTESQGNFIFTAIGRTMTAAAFRDACAKQGVMVGRDFPPMEKQWARISIGTMDEMQKATDVFRNVLQPAKTTAGGKR